MGSQLGQTALYDIGLVNQWVLQPANYIFDELVNAGGRVGDIVLPGSGPGVRNVLIFLSMVSGPGEARGLVKAAGREFEIVNYGDKLQGFQNHHGVLDKWAVENVPNYVSRAPGGPSMRLSTEAHDATRRVLTEFSKEMTGKPIAPIPWRNISPQQIQVLTERMFDAARVPAADRAAYYRAFQQYPYTGEWLL